MWAETALSDTFGGGIVGRSPTTLLQVSAHRFLVRRIECALLGRDLATANQPLRAQTTALAVGGVLAAIVLAAGASFGWLRPQADLTRPIVMAEQSGALYVRVGDIWHPVLNLASARLIAMTAANPERVRESDLSRMKRGPLLGIPDAPQLLGRPLSVPESAWAICDTEATGATTVIVGPADESRVRAVAPDHAVLVAAAPGSPAYLLYRGQRALVDLADAAVLRALALEGHAPRLVSQALLNAVPEAPPISTPTIRGVGGAGRLPGFAVGSVVRVTRGGGEEYYVVLPGGVQRIGQVAADLLRFTNSHGTPNTVTVAPDAIKAAGIVDTVPVRSFPDRAPALDGGGTVCVALRTTPAGTFDAAFSVGDALPVPAGQAPVALSQGDGGGPALDAVYLPPGRTAWVRADARAGTRYLVTDTGVRFAVHDDDAARDLGLDAPVPAPWAVLAALPSGPELSRRAASVARDTVARSP